MTGTTSIVWANRTAITRSCEPTAGSSLYAHIEGDQNGQELARSEETTPMEAGRWTQVTLDVTPTLVRWSRDEGSAIEIEDKRFRGGYIHLGKSSRDGRLLVRNLAIS